MTPQQNIENTSIILNRILFFTAFLASIVFVIANPLTQWVFNEIMRNVWPNALSSGSGLKPADFRHMFDQIGNDGSSRFRVLSYLVNMLDTKLSYQLLAHQINLVAASVTWPFIFFLGPILIFRILRDRLDAAAGWAGAAFYLTATSILSIGSVKFHGGKPASIIFATLLLYLVHRGVTGQLTRQRFSICLGLIALMTGLIPLCDEAGIAILGLVVMLNPLFLLRERRGHMILAALFCGLALAAGFVVFLLPGLTEAAGYQYYTGGGSIKTMLFGIFERPLSQTAANFGWTLLSGFSPALPFFDILAGSSLTPMIHEYPKTMASYPFADALLVDYRRFGLGAALLITVLPGLLLLGYFGVQLKSDARARSLALSALIGLVGVAVMQGILLDRNSFGYGTYYQGGVIALPYALFMASAFCAGQTRLFDRLIRAALLAGLLATAFYNHEAQRRFWRYWDAGLPMSADWFVLINKQKMVTPMAEETRAKLAPWLAANGLSDSDLAIYKYQHQIRNYPSLNSTIAVQQGATGYQHYPTPVTVLVGVNRIRAIRLNGQAANLQLPAEFADIPVIRNPDNKD